MNEKLCGEPITNHRTFVITPLTKGYEEVSVHRRENTNDYFPHVLANDRSSTAKIKYGHTIITDESL